MGHTDLQLQIRSSGPMNLQALLRVHLAAVLEAHSGASLGGSSGIVRLSCPRWAAPPHSGAGMKAASPMIDAIPLDAGSLFHSRARTIRRAAPTVLLL
jgi:hypothetical protein